MPFLTLRLVMVSWMSAPVPLRPAFRSVVDKEVDGEGSLPNRFEVNPFTSDLAIAGRDPRCAGGTHLLGAVGGQPNAGLTGQGLRLACAEPGDQLAIFGVALSELMEGHLCL